VSAGPEGSPSKTAAVGAEVPLAVWVSIFALLSGPPGVR
jgi:hypothetical protein